MVWACAAIFFISMIETEVKASVLLLNSRVETHMNENFVKRKGYAEPHDNIWKYLMCGPSIFFLFLTRSCRQVVFLNFLWVVLVCLTTWDDPVSYVQYFINLLEVSSHSAVLLPPPNFFFFWGCQMYALGFKKLTATNTYLHFYSYHPRHGLNAIKCYSLMQEYEILKCTLMICWRLAH